MNDKKNILRKRAETLSAQKEETIGTKEDRIKILEFLVASEKYGVEVQFVKEIVSYKGHTSMPKFENHILGFSNIRGQIFTLIDLEKIFNVERIVEPSKKKIIALNDSSLKVGFVADDVFGFEEIEKKSIQNIFDSLKNKKFDYVSGVTRSGISIINVEKIINLNKGVLC